MPAHSRRLRQLLSNPIATALLSAIVAADITHTPHSVLGPSKHWYPFPPGPPGDPLPGATNWPAQCLATRSDDGIRFIDGMFPKRVNPPSIATLHLQADRYVTGLWARTGTHAHFAVVTAFGTDFTAAEQQLCRDHLIDKIDSERLELSNADLARLRREDCTITRPLYAGYLHNILSLVALLALCCSLMWVPRTPAMFRALVARSRLHRGRSRLRRGLCPHCAYSLLNLAPDSPCPECGHHRSDHPHTK